MVREREVNSVSHPETIQGIHRHTHTYRHSHTDRHTHTYTQTHTLTHRQTHTHTQTQTDTHSSLGWKSEMNTRRLFFFLSSLKL